MRAFIARSCFALIWTACAVGIWGLFHGEGLWALANAAEMAIGTIGYARLTRDRPA